MKNLYKVILFVIVISAYLAGCSKKEVNSLEADIEADLTVTNKPTPTRAAEPTVAVGTFADKPDTSKQRVMAENFISLPVGEEEVFHGMTFDNNGNLYVVRQSNVSLGIVKITSDGKSSNFVDFNDYKNETGRQIGVNNMASDTENNIIMGGIDSVYKVTPDGKITLIISDIKDGEWGPVDETFDDEGYLYVAHGSKISVYDTAYEEINTFDIRESTDINSEIIGICFDNSYKYFYVCDCARSCIIKYAINKDKEFEKCKSFSLPIPPHYIASDDKGNILATSFDGSKYYLLDAKDNLTTLILGNKIEGANTIAFGSQKFGKEKVFITNLSGNIMTIDTALVISE